jgi:tripartite-type tricarboxylate transporter receptor subunit TctC
MCKKVIFLVACIALVFILIPNMIIFAATPYYEGKTVRIIVGFSPGGAFDVYARVIARHIGRHIPGNPTVIVENMTGAGSLISANHIYKVAKPDGLAIGHFHGVLFLKQILDQPGVEFDARKFKYIGIAAKEYDVILLSKARDITSVEKWTNSTTPVKLGGTAPLSDSQGNVFRILKGVIGLPTRIVDGYKGTADIRLAIEGGEVDGSGPSWDTGQKWLQAGFAVPVIQAAPKPLQELPDVPLMINLAKTNEARQLVETVIHGTCVFARPFVLPPGTPNEQEQILRKAFQETLQDKEFLAETEKAKMSIDPVTSEELEKAVTNLFKLPPALLVKLKEILLK